MTYSRVLVLVALFLTGCGTHGYIAAPPVEPDKAATLTMIRERLTYGSGVSIVVAVDNLDVVGLRSGDYATVSVPAGDRVISGDCMDTSFFGLVMKAPKPLRVTLQPGEHHYVLISPCAFREITASSAKDVLAESRPLRR